VLRLLIFLFLRFFLLDFWYARYFCPYSFYCKQST
jgi:hypothetical protein